MGTCGYRVYRHNRRYFVCYNYRDSYPDGLGVEILHEIPVNASKEEFEQWVRAIQENLDAQYENMKDSDPDSAEEYVTDQQPQNDVFIEWIYEIDLDNLTFHVNSLPMFRLDNMPPSDIFLKSISCDHFGHTAPREDTPIQFRYNWRAPPPLPSPESLTAYDSCHNRSSTSSMHDLLNVPVALSSIERVRTAFVELLVTRCMAEYEIGRYLRILESVPDRGHIPVVLPRMAISLVYFAVGPPIPSLPCIPHHPSQEFVWIRKDVCLRITTHLDDEDNLRASVGDLVRHINTTQDGEVGTVYGIAFSIFHCAIVRVDKDVEGTSYAHTPAFQFLPSFYARKISTPGIEAMSRLGCQASGVEFLTAISDAYNLPRITHEDLSAASSITAKVPVEVWTRIGDFFTSPADLVNLASISPQALSAAADLVRCPWVPEFRLVDVVGSAPPIPETTESTEDADIRYYFSEMGRANFTAVRGGRRVNVEMGQYDRWSDSRHEMSFEVETLLRGRSPVLSSQSKLYALELDDDDKATGS